MKTKNMQNFVDLTNWSDLIKKYVDELRYEDKIGLYYSVAQGLPDNFPHKPDGWEGFSDTKRKEYLDEIQYIVESRVGWKGFQRYYYKNVLGYTDLQFEDWWDSQKH